MQINRQSRLINILLKTAGFVVFSFVFCTGTATSDEYVWGSITGPTSDITTCSVSPDAVDITFTMLNNLGTLVANLALKQTPTCGTLTYNTETQIGTAQIVAFAFFGPIAEAKTITLNLIPSGLDLGIGNLFLANMLFDWGSTTGIPVSLVWDAQGILGEMDGSPTSFTLDPDGTINAANVFSDTGGIPGSDGTDDGAGGTINQGPRPLATLVENTSPVSGFDVDGNVICVPGADADFSNNLGGGCMNVTPSADSAQPIVVDNFINVFSPNDGISGNGMMDGPFKDFNANFDFNNMKLVSFTDTTPPAITLNPHVTPPGTSPLSLTLNVDTYTEPGATCTDAAPVGGSLAATIGGDTVDTGVGGIYTVTYDCQDGSGNDATQVTRTVIVASPGAPLVALNGSDPVDNECVLPYVDAGAICVDFEDGAISVGTGIPAGTSFLLDDTSNLDVNTVGSQFVTWTCIDTDANSTPLDRTVDVVDTTVPVVTLVGLATESLDSSTTQNPATYTDMGADATDTCDSVGFPLFIPIATSGAVNMVVPDTGADTLSYPLTYSATDTSANTGFSIRTVNVTRSQPVITLVGGGLILNVGDTYVEQGMDVADVQDGDVSGITTSGPCGASTCAIDSSAVDTSTAGDYIVTYDVTDNDANLATQVTRTVTIGVFARDSNFTMLDSNGNVFGGTNDVIFDWDQTLNIDESDADFTKMSISSQAPWPFFGFVWTAHHIRVYGPGTYTFDSTCTVAELEAGDAVCNNPLQAGQTEQFMSMTVGAGQVGAHILFDWNTSVNIDVVNVWDVDGVWDQHGDTNPKNQLWSGAAGLPPEPTTTWKLVSTDVNGDGVNASPMIDGPFQGFFANFSAGPAGTAQPPAPYTGTAPDTKLGSGLFASPMNPWVLVSVFMTLIGVRRFSKKQ